MKYPFPIFEYQPITQDSFTIFVYKTVRNTTISLKDINIEKIIGEKVCVYQILFVSLQHKNKPIKTLQQYEGLYHHLQLVKRNGRS